jgi:predicted phosphodiesterase
MRALPISDLHLERWGLRNAQMRLRSSTSFDVLVCAGDIWEGQPEKAVQAVVKLADGKPAVVVPGDQDFCTEGEDQRTISDFIRLMRDEADRQNEQARRDVVRVLSAAAPVCEIEHVRFIGLTLWTDWAQAGRWMPNPWIDVEEVWAARARALAIRRREWGAIRTERGEWTPYDAVAEHAREKAILLDQLTCHHPGPTVVVTHHPPLAECADAYRDRDLPWRGELPWWSPAFYASEILPLLPDQIRPDVWICGHVHAPFDALCGRTRVVCNPFQSPKFNRSLRIEV